MLRVRQRAKASVIDVDAQQSTEEAAREMTRQRTLLIAAGGGGDALAALMVADAAGLDPGSTVVASFAWERTMFDPRPGPRPPDHFSGLRRKGKHNWQITGRSRLREKRARSFLPQLVSERSASIWLLDARDGVAGLRRQLHEAAELHDADSVLVVDVGGDILARGDESWVKSPMADAMVLAAASSLASYVVVLGFGLDGELDPDGLGAELVRLRSEVVDLPETLPARTARRFADSFSWSPSEATGLAYMVARGWRGRAEIRGDGVEVELSQSASQIMVYGAHDLLRHSLIAQALRHTMSFDEAEDVIRRLGLLPEREVERSARLRTRQRTGDYSQEELEERLLRYCDAAARNRGVDYLTTRRVGELLDLDAEALRGFLAFLGERHPGRLRPPAWPTR